MDTSDIILSISVGVALLIGVSSILLTYKMQQRHFKHNEKIRETEKHEEFLNEIIEWATNIYEKIFGSELEYESVTNVTQRKRVLYMGNRISRYQGWLIRSKRLVGIATLFNDKLQSSLSEVIKNIEFILPMLHEQFNEKKEGQTELQRTAEIRLGNSLTELIQTASDIKAGYIR